MSDNEEIISTKMWISITFRMLMLPPAMALLIHWPANEWDWIDGWAVIGAFFFVALIAVIWLAKSNPEIVVERMKGNFQEGQPLKDSIIIAQLSIFMLAIFPVAGFDRQYGWMQLGFFWKIIGWMMFLFSIYMLYEVFSANKFLSRSIVVQEERKQEVVKVGPYGKVRHPMYTAVVVMVTGIVFALGSAVALIPTIISFLFLYWRAVSEEDLLAQELEGYAEYREEVRHRLIPWII